MKIVICNCNNIKNYKMEIEENKLNIKYGTNGTGKSTVSNVIKDKIEKDDLSAFKHYVSNELPNLIYDKDIIKSILIYNDDYVNQYLFESENNIHRNAFNVFAKTPDYDEKIKKINDKFNIVKDEINSNDKLDEFILNYELLDKMIKITSANKLVKSGVVKSLNNGNKILNIPSNLIKYESLIKSDEKIKWYDWYTSGFVFYDNKKCPFCTLKNDELLNEKEEIDKLFIKVDVNNITTTSNIVEDISSFLSNETITTIKKILNNEKEIDDDKKQFLLDFKLEYRTIYNKLLSLREINYLSITKLDDIKQYVSDLQFNLEAINKFKSEEFISILNNINILIKNILLDISEIEKETSILNSNIKVYIKKNENLINDFLLSIGMTYKVKIERESIKLLFKSTEVIVEPKSHLSWGEKNSFALSLFLFDCLFQKPDLIVLDDPVSSFDNNKKYGIMHYLFKKNNSLRDKTVLLFSHDIEPIINFYKKDKSVPNYVSVYSLSNNSGIISEKVVLSSDILSVIDTCKLSAKNESLNIISRLINCRRLFELEQNYIEAYNILSCLFHNKDIIATIDGNALSDSDIKKGVKDINEYVNSFNYDDLKAKFNSRETLKAAYEGTKSNYEKIEIFRLINMYFNLDGCDDNIMKFINETYHIENSFIFQLDPYKYDLVPNYIVEICDKKISKF